MGSVCIAYCDIETLGCSPFHLLYGRAVAGTLALLKSSLLHDVDVGTAKQNAIELMLNTREQLKSKC